MADRNDIERRYPGLSLGHVDPVSGEMRYGREDIRKIELFDFYSGTCLEGYIESHLDYFGVIRSVGDGWGRYRPTFDAEAAHSERSRGGYRDGPAEFKVHLNPAAGAVPEVAFLLMDQCRESEAFADALDEMKFAHTEGGNKNLARLVLYPDGGSLENARTLLAEIIPRTAGRFPSYAHRPRHSLPITDLCYLAQGSGDAKDADRDYLEQYDPATGYVLLPEYAAAAQAVRRELKGIAQS